LKGAQYDGEISPGVGEVVLGAGAFPWSLVVILVQDPGGDELVESGAEHVRGDAEVVLKVGEPGDSHERFSKDQQRPTLADHR
jgi:hypothetical protein